MWMRTYSINSKTQPPALLRLLHLDPLLTFDEALPPSGLARWTRAGRSVCAARHKLKGRRHAPPLLAL